MLDGLETLDGLKMLYGLKVLDDFSVYDQLFSNGLADLLGIKLLKL